MFEKVNPMHPDKIADRIAGAIVDLAYTKSKHPRVAVEVMVGHGNCFVVIETSEFYAVSDIDKIVERIAGNEVGVNLVLRDQDPILSQNQNKKIRVGDNGIFKGVPIRKEAQSLSILAKALYQKYPYDGKFIADKDKLVICQSRVKTSELKDLFPKAIINPLGDWTGGINVDTGCTNRKLGSDMDQAVTGGGLHGKDLSKADVSVNIYAHLKAQETGEVVEFSTAIGDEVVDGKPYSEIVEIARKYINEQGGFERFAEWGLV